MLPRNIKDIILRNIQAEGRKFATYIKKCKSNVEVLAMIGQKLWGVPYGERSNSQSMFVHCGQWE